MSFSEANLENLIIDMIKDKNYTYVHGDSLEREYTDVILEDDLKRFLSERYKANGITSNEINQINMSLKSVSANPLYDANKTVFKRIVEGEIFVREDRSQKDFWLQLIDFNDITKNIFKVCNHKRGSS